MPTAISNLEVTPLREVRLGYSIPNLIFLKNAASLVPGLQLSADGGGKFTFSARHLSSILFPTIVSRNRKIFSQKGIQFVTANKEHCFMQLGLPDVWSTDKWRKDGFSTNQWVPGSHGAMVAFSGRGPGFDSIKTQVVFFYRKKGGKIKI